MATPSSQELQAQQQTTLQGIRQVLMEANFPEEAANEKARAKEQLAAQKEGNQIAEDASKGATKRSFDESKQRRNAQGQFIKQTTFLQKIFGLNNWMKKFTQESAKKALALASKLKIDDIGKNMAKKANQFAGDLLNLLLKGIGLAALWKLLDFISKQDWEKLYNEHKDAIVKFFDAIGKVTAAVVGWKTAKWLTEGSIHGLWKALTAVFGVGGKMATLVTDVGKWATATFFDPKEGVLTKLWSAIKTIFGAGGKFLGLVTEVGKWSGSVIFDLTKGSLGLLWTAIKGVFAVGGTIALLADDIQANWTGHKMFGPEGAIRKAWSGLTKIFGNVKDGMVQKFFDFVDKLKDFTGFGPDGAFQRSWNSIKSLYGAGKGAVVQGFLNYVDEAKTAASVMFGETGPFQKSWKSVTAIFGADGKVGKFLTEFLDIINNPDIFGEAGPFRRAWKGITGIFGAGGKISQGWAVLQDVEDWVGEKSDLKSMFDGMTKIFGKEGKIAKGWQTASSTFGNFFGAGSPIDNVMKSFNTMFGPESTIGKFLKPADDVPSGPGFIQRIKTIFSAEGAVGKLFGIFSGIGDTMSSVGTKIMDSAPVKIMKKIFGFAAKAGGAAVAAGGTILATVGRIFAPLGWIMAIFEGVSGFIEGFKDQGSDDTRTMGQKISDGLKGAIDALVGFFVVDLLQLIEDVINWGITQLNKLPFIDIKPVSFAEGVGDAIKGVTDAAVDAVTGADDLSPEEKKEQEKLLREATARKMMFGLGVGKYDKGFFSDDVDIDSKNLASKLKGMDAEQIGRLQKAMEVASKGKASFDVSGEDWRKVFAKELKTRSAEERQAATTAMIAPIQINQTNTSNPQSFSGGSSAGSKKHEKLTSG